MTDIEAFLAGCGLAISDRDKFRETLTQLSGEPMVRMMLKSQGIDVKKILTQVSVV